MITNNIVIWATPRTGSTALGQWLKARFGLDQHEVFNEPEHAGKLVHLEAYHKLGLPWIAKLHWAQLERYPEYWQSLFRSEQTLKVRLQRRDLRAQIASFYLAEARQVSSWQFTKSRESPWDSGEPVIIDHSNIQRAIRAVYDQRLQLSEWQQAWWQDLWYEDLALERTDHRPTPKPQNYDAVLAAVESSMRDFEEITLARKIFTPRKTR